MPLVFSVSPSLDNSRMPTRDACSQLETSCYSSKSNYDLVAIYVIVGLVVLLIKLAIIVYCCCKYRRRKLRPDEVQSEISLGSWQPGFPVNISYKQLEIATQSFSQKLGEGAFGTVYKGRFPDGTPVAVKKLEGLSQGDKEFTAEVVTIGTLHHVNLVRLYGFCTKRSEQSSSEQRLLVYEYMPNGSLDRFLFRQAEDTPVLDWETRMKIIVGTARGIAYFHEQARANIIHCDLKPENVLLDAEFCPKISDFGLAKLMSKDQTRTVTNIRGTRGYLAPEWLADLPITVKADVYSFGKLLLEIIGGRRNLDLKAKSDKVYFPSWAYSEMLKGNYAGIVDERLNGKYDIEQVRRAVLVAFWCIQDDPELRPGMGDVVQMMEGRVSIAKPPLPKIVAMMMPSCEDSRLGEMGGGNQSAHLSSSLTNLIEFEP